MGIVHLIQSKTFKLLVLTLALSGCSSTPKKESITENDPIQLQEIRTLVNSIHKKLDSMDDRLVAMDKKLEAKPVLNSHDLKIVPSPTVSHPADGLGAAPVANLSNRDPEIGYAHDDAIQEYRKGMIYYQSRKYADAILSFSGFLDRFPDHPLAGSAQFYVGDSYMQQKEYRLAIQEFQRVLTSYDRSSHISDSLREIAEAEDLTRQADLATQHRQLLLTLFPQSPAASATSGVKTVQAEPLPGVSAARRESESLAQPQVESKAEALPAIVPATAQTNAPTNGAEIKMETPPETNAAVPPTAPEVKD